MSAPGGRGDVQASVGCWSIVVISAAMREHVKLVLHGVPCEGYSSAFGGRMDLGGNPTFRQPQPLVAVGAHQGSV